MYFHTIVAFSERGRNTWMFPISREREALQPASPERIHLVPRELKWACLVGAVQGMGWRTMQMGHVRVILQVRARVQFLKEWSSGSLGVRHGCSCNHSWSSWVQLSHFIGLGTGVQTAEQHLSCISRSHIWKPLADMSQKKNIEVPFTF